MSQVTVDLVCINHRQQALLDINRALSVPKLNDNKLYRSCCQWVFYCTIVHYRKTLDYCWKPAATPFNMFQATQYSGHSVIHSAVPLSTTELFHTCWLDHIHLRIRC